MSIINKNLKKFKSKSEDLENENKKSWNDLVEIIQKIEDCGNKIIKLSKEAINFSINRNFISASESISRGNKAIKGLNIKIIFLKNKIGEFISESKIEIGKIGELKVSKLDEDFLNAREEFLEANFLFAYLKTGKIFNPTDLLLNDFKIYAGGLADFCGELIKCARLDIINGKDKIKKLKKYQKILDEVYQSLSSFSFSNKSGVRAKIENLKGYIKEFEHILYDNKINSRFKEHILDCKGDGRRKETAGRTGQS